MTIAGIFFESYNWWLVVNLVKLKHVLVILRVETRARIFFDQEDGMLDI
jgi:hypothetical protein